MGKSPNGGYKDKMRDDCVFILVKVLKSRRITITALAEERGISPRSVYRWVKSFSLMMPIEVKSGVVTVGDEHFQLNGPN